VATGSAPAAPARREAVTPPQQRAYAIPARRSGRAAGRIAGGNYRSNWGPKVARFDPPEQLSLI